MEYSFVKPKSTTKIEKMHLAFVTGVTTLPVEKGIDALGINDK